MKRYYISHPYTGNEEKNKADADRIRAALKEANPSICFMNPLWMFGNKDTYYCTTLADALELLSSCEAVIFCPGWEDSTGCRAEKAFALQQGIRIMYLQDFPEVMRHLANDMVKEDLANALKDEAVRHKDTPICTTIIKAVGGRIIHENRHDE